MQEPGEQRSDPPSGGDVWTSSMKFGVSRRPTLRCWDGSRVVSTNSERASVAQHPEMAGVPSCGARIESHCR